MVHWVWLLVAVVCSSWGGFFLACLLGVSGRKSQDEEVNERLAQILMDRNNREDHKM